MVFNLEVDAEHVYCVGLHGALVHNACPVGYTPGIGVHEAGKRVGAIRKWMDDLPEVQVARDYLEELGVQARGLMVPPDDIPRLLRENGEEVFADAVTEAGGIGMQRLQDLFRNWPRF